MAVFPTKLIDGVVVAELKVIPDERGRLTELLRSDAPYFKGIGQVYMTTAYPGVVKGWHYHKKQTDSFVCLDGMMKLALFDGRKDSPTQGLVNEFFLGPHNPILVQIPPYVYHGFKAVGPQEALAINMPDQLYSYAEPDEYRLPPHGDEIPYQWDRQDR